MNKATSYGYIKGGKLVPHNRRRLQEDLRRFPDCEVEVTIKKKGKRSTEANAYYWGIVVEEIRIRLRELGNDFDRDTVHEYLKQRFNSVKVPSANGEVMEIGQTTTDMNVGEFSEYVSKVIQWAAEFLELPIPPPNSQVKMFA